MKVALIIEHFDRTRGSAEHLAVWLANELARRGHEIHVVCHDVSARVNRYRQATLRASHDADLSHHAHPATMPDPDSAPENSPAIHLHRLKGMRVNTGFGFRRFGRRARRWCAAHQPDIVHSFTLAYPGDIYHACAGVFAAMQSRAKDIESTQRTTAWARMLQRLTGKQRTLLVLERRALHKPRAIVRRRAKRLPEAARVISLCTSMTQQLQQFYQVDPRRILQMPTPRMDLNGASPVTPDHTHDERQWFRAHYRLAPDDRVALFVGHDFRRKGLRYAIEAIARTQTHWKLLVVGLGKAREYVELAEKLGVGESTDRPIPPPHSLASHVDPARTARVLFVGPTRQMNRVYAAADALLLPTFYDSFGLVVMEAFAHGLPVVTTEFLGARELVRSHNAGTIVPSPRSVEQIAAALDALPRAKTPEAAALASRARAAADGVTPEQYMEALLNLYADVQKE